MRTTITAVYKLELPMTVIVPCIEAYSISSAFKYHNSGNIAVIAVKKKFLQVILYTHRMHL
jgi:predicted 2-oxoglutarate/Fe(II)-dependent dioxygenase YbiX